ncbi:MAG: hypothetical protein Q4E53_02915 [Eubacteriales bacterium]|nr:hypothetical protein [Eubacteriales bacterium]
MTLWNPEIPIDIQETLMKEKNQAFTLYLDFIIDGTASMYTVYPAVYFAAIHLIEALSKYEIYPRLGMTIIRDEKGGEETELIHFDSSYFTEDSAQFLKKMKNIPLYGGGDDGKESVHTAIKKSLAKFGDAERNHAIIVFSDAYGSNDYAEYFDHPIGQAIFFTTEKMSEEDFRFAFINADGTINEEASPMFLDIRQILKPLSSQMIDNVVKPLKDIMKGVSIGA